jgi:chromosome segregation ATPase
MSLSDRLDEVLMSQLELLRELRAARDELAVVHGRVRMRAAELEEQANEVGEHYRQAAEEGDPEAETLRDMSDRIKARIEDLKAADADLEATETGLHERIRRAELDIEDFRVLQPQIIARAAAARSAGVGREVFETLADALHYVEIAIAAATPEDPNGPLKKEP